MRRTILLHRPETSHVDAALLKFVQGHANLFLACIALGLSVWEMFRHEYLLACGMVLTGAVGFFYGLLFGLCAAMPFLAHSVYLQIASSHFSVASIGLQVLGFACIAWLGYRHKSVIDQQSGPIQVRHDPQVLPWNTVNDVRTSLAAIRFLLFPLQCHAPKQELLEVTNELSRLEDLFQEMEARQPQMQREAR